jgi:acyl-CoA reductase-like NAD-dependent aldehyde dehydrogenase
MERFLNYIAGRPRPAAIFGPVAVAIPFEDEHEAIEIANDTPYGLAAGVWTESVRRALRMTRALAAGTVWVNTYRRLHWQMPFGGPWRAETVPRTALRPCANGQI